MKKIFKIASYDFKRLVFNPITLIVFILVLGICLIVGLVYKIEPTPAYSASISGTTTKEVFANFTSNNANLDTKTKLDETFEDAKLFITVQKECFDYDDLSVIKTKFTAIYYEILKFHTTGSCSYTENNNINEIKNSAQTLVNFVEHFKTIDEFQSNVIFEDNQFKKLESLSTFFYEQSNSTADITIILNNLYDNITNFTDLSNLIKEVFIWKVDDEQLTNYETKYIEKAKIKKDEIFAEMTKLNNEVDAYDLDNVEAMQNLATNYKLTCESAKYSIEYELKLLLNKHFGNLKNLYHYEPFSLEETKLALTKTNFFLNDKSLYYTQYQVPLNFNTASHQVTVFDHSYFIISIIGFLAILFGIFCSYKLFGRDRRNGKMDVILSQNVTFNQVFAGKFLAIVFSTSFFLLLFAIFSLIWGALLYSFLPNSILAVFNLSSAYTIHPLLFYIIKLFGIEFQVIFYSVITIFLMNISRKFDITFAIAVVLFVTATICNIFFNTTLIYCLFPFIHADLTSFLGGGTMATGFLKTSLYTYGNFFISLVYYLVIVVLLYNFTKQLFKKN